MTINTGDNQMDVLKVAKTIVGSTACVAQTDAVLGKQIYCTMKNPGIVCN